MINKLIQNLIAINNITEGQKMSFGNALSIVKRYNEMPEPNDLIDEAEILAASGIEVLERAIIEVRNESERFLNVSLPLLKNIDFRAIAQSYTHAFYDRFHNAEVELNPYWKVYCQLNNRLDYLKLDSTEYHETEKSCADAKAKHDERQKEVHRLYSEYEQANEDSASVFLFKADFLEAIIIRYRDIASAILTDIKRIREGA